MFFEPEFWVAVAFVILMGLFAYLGVHRTVLQTLDRRSERLLHVGKRLVGPHVIGSEARS